MPQSSIKTTARTTHRTTPDMRTPVWIKSASRGIPAIRSKGTQPHQHTIAYFLQQNDMLHLKTRPLLQWIAAEWTGQTLSKRPPGIHKRDRNRESWANVEEQGVQCRALIEQRPHVAGPESEPEAQPNRNNKKTISVHIRGEPNIGAHGKRPHPGTKSQKGKKRSAICLGDGAESVPAVAKVRTRPMLRTSPLPHGERDKHV